jgi:prepilin-type N-terminal cleavage/methylation domain-containing protein
MRTTFRQAGFTLVEIAIVLVIIGLLLGGILKGQEMITQARIKNVINDFNGITAAYFSYQDRYRAVPGDDINALGRWGLVAGDADAGATMANGQLDPPGGTYNPASAAPQPEARLFWWHLRQAGFIPGPTYSAATPVPAAQTSALPTNAFGAPVGATSGTGAATLGLNGLIICSSGVPDKVAIAVDTQMDDQNAASGTVRGVLGAALAAIPAPPNNNYAETGANQYLMCKSV